MHQHDRGAAQLVQSHVDSLLYYHNISQTIEGNQGLIRYSERAPVSFLQLLLLPVLSIELNQRLNQLNSSANQGKNSRHDGENLKSWFSSQIHKNSLRLLPFSSRFLLLVTSSDVLGASLCAPQIPRMWPMAWNKKQNQQARP